MPDVRNMHFILGDRIENEIAQARYDDHSHVALAGFRLSSGVSPRARARSISRLMTHDVAIGSFSLM
jgi:hypothetical protein